jgi:DNA-binding transcriptional LysR family regulator
MGKSRRLFTPMDLQILVGLAEGKTQARIAAELDLAQPAVSKHLGVLEKEAGIALVHRDGRRVRLTSTGHHIADRAKNVLLMLDEIEGMVAGQHSSRRGFVRLLASTTPGGYALPPAIGEFLRQSPQVKVDLDVRPLAQLWQTFRGGAYDLAVIPEGPAPAEVRLEVLYNEPLVIFTHPSHPLAKRTSVTVEDLTRERLVGRFISETEPRYWQTVFRGRTIDTARRPNFVELHSIEAAKRLVESGLGVGILYESVVRRDIDEGRLAQLDVVGVELGVPFCLAQATNLRQTTVAKRFAAFLREYFGQCLVETAASRPLP